MALAVLAATDAKAGGRYLERFEHLGDGILVIHWKNSKEKDVVKKAPKIYQDMADKLHKAARIKAHPKIYINYNNPDIGGYTIGNVIVIYVGELRYTRDDPDMLAATMAHEIAHMLLNERMPTLVKQCRKEYFKKNKYCEKRADLIGKDLMRQVGYDQCAAARWFKKLIEREGDGGGITHPTYKERYEYLRCK